MADYNAGRIKSLEKLLNNANSLKDAIKNSILTATNPKDVARLQQDLEQTDEHIRGIQKDLNDMKRQAGTPVAPVSPTTSQPLKVFLCHATDDKTKGVTEVDIKLHKKGYETWIDKDELIAGDEWNKTIRRNIKEEADAVIVFLSHEFLHDTSKYRHRELGWAIARAEEKNEKFFLFVVWLKKDCVQADGCQARSELSGYQQLNYENNPFFFDQLLTGLEKRAKIVGKA